MPGRSSLLLLGAALLLWCTEGRAQSSRLQQLLDQVQPPRIEQDVVDLAGLGGRFALSDSFEQATLLVQTKLEQTGLPTRLDPFQIGEIPLSNVVALARGSGDRPAIIVCAHYDSISFPAGSPSPGAEDNASGVAALLELARLVASESLATDVRLVAFAAEEQGLLGSQHMAGQLQPGEVQAVINMDMVGYTPGHRPPQIILDTYRSGRSLAARLADATMTYSTLEVVAGLFSQGRSDHKPFWAVGIPALTVASAYNNEYPHYHTALDLPAQVDPRTVAQVVRAVAARVLMMAGLADGPPVARVSPFVTALTGQRVTLSGAGSFDPQGMPLDLSWRQLDGPSVPLEITDETISFVPDEQGAYRFQLTVTAADGRTSEPEIGAAVVSEGGCAMGSGSGGAIWVLVLLVLFRSNYRRAPWTPRRTPGAEPGAPPPAAPGGETGSD